MRRGVAGAVLCALALGALWAITVPAFWPVDELSHVPYARAVVEGRLPTIDTPITAEGVPGLSERLAFERATGYEQRQDVWTSNHPPLYFLLAGLPLVAGEALGAPGLGFLGARAVSVLAAALGVALTAMIAAGLLPQRPRVVVGAAAVAALVPSLNHFSGLVFNDTSSFALCTLVLLLALLALRDGPRPWLLPLALAGAAAALTRVAALPLVALAAAACALGALQTAPATSPPVRRWGRAVAAGLVAAGVPALGSGWFYLRNLQRYGDLTGAQALLEKFGRDPNAELDDLVLGGRFYLGQWDRLLGDLSTGVWAEGWRLVVIRSLGALILLGLAVGAARWVGVLLARDDAGGGGRSTGARARQLVGLDPDPARWRAGGWRWWAWPLALAFPAGLLLATARFHARGGSPHARYLLSALAVIAVVAALGLAQVDRRGRPWPMLAGLAALVVAGLGVWFEFLAEGARVWTLDGEVHPLVRIGEGWNEPAVAMALIGLVVGLALVAQAVRALPARVGPAAIEPAASAPPGELHRD